MDDQVDDALGLLTGRFGEKYGEANDYCLFIKDIRKAY